MKYPNFFFKYLKFIAFFIIIVDFATEANSQCSCTNGASIGGMMPSAGTSNVGVLLSKNIRANFSYIWGNSTQTYFNDIKIDDIDVKSMMFQYGHFSVGYGINYKLTLEMESGFFLNKEQKIADTTFSGSGISHIGLTAKYNLWSSISKEMEFSTGLSIIIPTQFQKDNLPQNIMPSSGAFGGSINSFFYKGWRKTNSRLILQNKTGIWSPNQKYSYQYGNYSISSIILSKTLDTNFNIIIDFRNEFRLKDIVGGNKFKDSGGYSFEITPQFNYTWKNWNFSTFANLPLYQFLNGKQLGKGTTYGININWEWDFDQPDLEDEIDD